MAESLWDIGQLNMAGRRVNAARGKGTPLDASGIQPGLPTLQAVGTAAMNAGGYGSPPSLGQQQPRPSLAQIVAPAGGATGSWADRGSIGASGTWGRPVPPTRLEQPAGSMATLAAAPSTAVVAPPRPDNPAFTLPPDAPSPGGIETSAGLFGRRAEVQPPQPLTKAVSVVPAALLPAIAPRGGEDAGGNASAAAPAAPSVATAPTLPAAPTAASLSAAYPAGTPAARSVQTYEPGQASYQATPQDPANAKMMAEYAAMQAGDKQDRQNALNDSNAAMAHNVAQARAYDQVVKAESDARFNSGNARVGERGNAAAQQRQVNAQSGLARANAVQLGLSTAPVLTPRNYLDEAGKAQQMGQTAVESAQARQYGAQGLATLQQQTPLRTAGLQQGLRQGDQGLAAGAFALDTAQRDAPLHTAGLQQGLAQGAQGNQLGELALQQHQTAQELLVAAQNGPTPEARQSALNAYYASQKMQPPKPEMIHARGAEYTKPGEMFPTKEPDSVVMQGRDGEPRVISLNGGLSAQRVPSAAAIEALKKNPGKKAEFEAYYGPGSAAPHLK